MTPKQKIRVSRKLSLLLRHKPQAIGLQLDPNGWASVPELLRLLKLDGTSTTFAELADIVATNDKQRFSFNDDRTLIRANQGHSLKTVDLEFTPVKAPETLYHGTATRFLKPILQSGLRRQNRQHVHLSHETETATKVGTRHGKVVILEVDAAAMMADGHHFYRSANGVWLADEVPARYLSVLED